MISVLNQSEFQRGDFVGTVSQKLNKIWKLEHGPKDSDEPMDMERLEEICKKEGVKLATYLQYADRINDEEYTQECLELNFHQSSAKNKVPGKEHI